MEINFKETLKYTILDNYLPKSLFALGFIINYREKFENCRFLIQKAIMMCKMIPTA